MSAAMNLCSSGKLTGRYRKLQRFHDDLNNSHPLKDETNLIGFEAQRTFFGEIRAILIYLGSPRYPSEAVTFF